MISIKKADVELIRKYFPYVHIRRTMHKWYMEENPKAIAFLNSVNNKG